jgi:zinc protease
MKTHILAAFCAIGLGAPALSEVDIQHVTSPGGVQAWLVQDESIPFVAIDFWFQGGAVLDGDDTQGATYLMTGLLNEGAGDLDAQGFARAVEGLAANFSFDLHQDTLIVSAQILTQNRDQAAQLLRDALVAPRFDPAPLDRVRAQVLAIIQGNAQDPGEIAQSAFRARAFAGHPYARPIEGRVETVTALSRNDVIAAHRAALTRDHVVVGAAGDISAQDLGALVDFILGDLPLATTPPPGPAQVNLPGGVDVVDFPTPQSVAVFGHAGIARDDPDFFAAFVLNQIMGGGNFRSRLMQEVRVERGLTYGIGTYLSLADHAPMVLGQFSSSNELVADAIDLIRAQWADIAANGVSQDELDAAIQYLTGAYPLRFEGNGLIAAMLAGMQSDDMPIDYILTRNDRVAAVTRQDVARVAARLLDPDGLHFVIVGQPQGLAD